MEVAIPVVWWKRLATPCSSVALHCPVCFFLGAQTHALLGSDGRCQFAKHVPEEMFHFAMLPTEFQGKVPERLSATLIMEERVSEDDLSRLFGQWRPLCSQHLARDTISPQIAVWNFFNFKTPRVQLAFRCT